MLRKLAATQTILLSAVIVKKTSSDEATKTTQTDNESKKHYLCKPSELPLYTPLHTQNAPKKESHPPKESSTPSAIESGVRAVRTEVQSGYKSIADQVQVAGNYINTAKEHSQATIDYLNQPHNVLPRAGAIAIGGLAGFIFAARRGFIKKVLYTGIGAGAIASICYPRQAEQLGRDALYEARKGFAIAYNFAKGVKPGDEIPVEPINKFPTTVEELKYLIMDLFDEAKMALFPEKKK